ncbi:hydrogenase maturation protease [Mesorhizobium sp.]|uniref:hydrogenase maturation protease n=1 Tax=Mesorhizobium sp. TaxID=1871066 RepID=UPI000FE8DF93|nr:hydrogenase maturation protease [Mesorhizobium sp.]RWE29556.1 MAG: hydrogenase maturation protease [Mesorhizobium sp.]
MIAVVGCGNLNRHDDGAGPEVIRVLRAAGLEGPDVKLLDAGTDGMAVMFAARGCRSLILIDAARSGVEAGAIYEVPGHELARPYSPGLNLHDFRWDAALHAGRQIFGAAFPDDVTVFLIEAGQLDLGLGLSVPVAKAALLVAHRIAEIVANRLAAGQQ